MATGVVTTNVIMAVATTVTVTATTTTATAAITIIATVIIATAIIATAIVLFVAFCVGWFANWLIHRFVRVQPSEVGELERLAQELHEAEETRDQAITYLQQREAELTNQLSQTEALAALRRKEIRGPLRAMSI